QLFDEDEDGLCCEYGEGSYLLLDNEGNILAEGGEFGDEEVTDFCVPYVPPPTGGECTYINFIEMPVLSYGINQDVGPATVSADGNELRISNNAWKAVELPYTVTPNTFLAFDFRSTIEGEIHGIGLDDNMWISPEFTFRVYGNQNWGISDFDNYSGDGNWRSYLIPIGEYVTGEARYLFFVADHDIGARNGNSFFRNVQLYEGEPCTEDLSTSAVGLSAPLDIRLWPNPSPEQLQVETVATGDYAILDLRGTTLQRGSFGQGGRHQLDITELPPGTYFFRLQTPDGEKTARFLKAQ
ncbi:MAG: T9SS type A sorting domain-containing protein, partial [Bacteroidota bacterium]